MSEFTPTNDNTPPPDVDSGPPPEVESPVEAVAANDNTPSAGEGGTTVDTPAEVGVDKGPPPAANDNVQVGLPANDNTTDADTIDESANSDNEKVDTAGTDEATNENQPEEDVDVVDDADPPPTNEGSERRELDEVFHYTSDQAAKAIMDPNSEESGLRAGAHVTPDGTLTPDQAAIDLALSAGKPVPDAVIRVDLAAWKRDGYQSPSATTVGRLAVEIPEGFDKSDSVLRSLEPLDLKDVIPRDTFPQGDVTNTGKPGGGLEMKVNQHIPLKYLTRVR
jgi:hypothetical protein